MKEVRQRLSDIVERAAEIDASVAGMDRLRFLAAFRGDRGFADTLCYRIIVVGEAITVLVGGENRQPLLGRLLQDHPEVDWIGFIGLRNVVAHQYDTIDPERIWDAIHDELPLLRRAVARQLRGASR